MEEVGFCSSSRAIDSSNVGFQLLKKCGWKEGTGLGVSEQGRLEPVETHVQTDKRGLGAEKTKQTDKLQVKKMRVLQGGAPAESVRTCEICNVVCNSDKVFASHLAGEKHKLRMIGRPPNFASKPISTMNVIASTSKAGNLVRSSFCDLCKVTCSSQEAFNTHISGDEHQANLNPDPVKTNHGTSAVKVVDVEVKKTEVASGGAAAGAVKVVDLEVKKMKVVNGGAAAGAVKVIDLEVKKMRVVSGGAAESAVKVCMDCNVVCNSQQVYNSHIAGKKHVANVAKLQQSAPTV